MISEVANALFVTYLATEYVLVTGNNSALHRNAQASLRQRRLSGQALAGVCVVATINVIDRVSGLQRAADRILDGFLHTPRIVFAAVAFILALWIDCKRVSPNINLLHDFLPTLGRQFLIVLPVYPFLAVLISFGLMVVIRLFEVLHLPLELLNGPIYYGTLYGPFSFVYLRVKSRVVEVHNSLPV